LHTGQPAEQPTGALQPVTQADPNTGISRETDNQDDLTKRELEVLKLMAEGLTDAQVADRLVLSTRTVQAHVRSIYSKLDIATRSAATRYAIKRGLV
jgi:DNA-binding NarL/FixJ family response regulator